VTAERREAIAGVRREWAASRAALRGERVVVDDDVRHIVDGALLRVALLPGRRSGARAVHRSRLRPRPCLAAAMALSR